MNDEEILFENKTEYSEETLKKFCKFVCLKYNKFKYWKILASVILFLAIGVYGAIHQIIQYHRVPNAISICCILICATIIFKIIEMTTGNAKAVRKAKKITNKYEFTDKYMVVSNELSSQKFLYEDLSQIQSICSTERYIYIMANERAGYIIDKNGFTNYDEEAFNHYLQIKFKDKYIGNVSKKKLCTVKDILSLAFWIFCFYIMIITILETE